MATEPSRAFSRFVLCSVGHISRRRQEFHLYSCSGKNCGKGSLIDPECRIALCGQRLFDGRQFHATACSLLAPRCLAEDSSGFQLYSRLVTCDGRGLMTKSRHRSVPGNCLLFMGWQFRRGSDLSNKHHVVFTVLSIGPGIAVLCYLLPSNNY